MTYGPPTPGSLATEAACLTSLSPNTPGLRDLQTGEDLERLLDRVLDARDAACPPPARPPVLLKIAPDLSPAQRQHVAHCALARRVGIHSCLSYGCAEGVLLRFV